MARLSLRALNGKRLQFFFPFLLWGREIGPGTLRADLIAGITVALVAIPQSLAYAQLAGVPAYYGLYATLLPCVIGILFGSSRQLSTGPVAMTSLLTAASVSTLSSLRCGWMSQSAVASFDALAGAGNGRWVI